MKIETKFDINEEVYYLSNEKVTTKCFACKGKNEVIIDNVEFSCIKCNDGKIFKYKNFKRYCIIQEIKIWHGGMHHGDTEYYVSKKDKEEGYNYYLKFREEHLYKDEDKS